MEVAAANGMLARSTGVEMSGHKGAEDHDIRVKDPNQNEDTNGIAGRLIHLLHPSILPPRHHVHGHVLERGKRKGIN